MIMNKQNYLIVLFLWIFISYGTGQNVHILKNQKIEFSIDSNGNMITLKNLQTGFNYASGKPMWRLYFDSKKEKDIEILANDNQPFIKQSGNQILINYDNLSKGNQILKFKLSLRIVLEENQVRFCSEITNNELHTIVRELQYPLIANCEVPSDHRLLTTETGGKLYTDPKKQILSIPYSYMGPDQKFRQMNVKYPSGVASNCFALVGKYQGLYIGSHDSTFQDTWHGLRLYPDNKHVFSELEVGLYKYPNCLSGKTWSNEANVVAPYSGDWHQTSVLYRKWANTWWQHSDEPLWVRQMNGFQRIIMRHQYGETFFTYNDFATRVKKAGESVGINVVFPFGWWDSGMDNGYPDSYYVTDTDQGGNAAWGKAITDFKTGGGKVILYYNGKLIDTESDYYKKGDGQKVSMKSNTGTEMVEAYRFYGPGTFTGYYNTRSFVVADTKNPKWQKKLLEMADNAYNYGANSVFYDQLGYGETSGNWDITKEFPIPDLCIIADKGKALKMAHDYINLRDKDFAIGTEHITDVTSQYCDYVHSIFDLSEKNSFVDWFRYTFPEIILSERNIDGDEPDIKWLINRGVLLGLRNNLQIYRLRATIDETPHYQQYLANVNKLKDKYKDLLLLGIYRDTEGFSVDDETVKARSFVNGNRMAVVVTQSIRDSVSMRINVPGYQYVESTVIGVAKVGTITIGQQSIAVGRDGLVVLIYKKID
jgi:hypothetical protein